MSRRKEPAIPADLLDQFRADTDAATVLAQGGLLDALKKALAERALNAEMDHHLAHRLGFSLTFVGHPSQPRRQGVSCPTRVLPKEQPGLRR